MRFKKSASVLLSAALVLGVYSANPISSEAAATEQVLAGSNRHSTAVQVSQKGWSSSENVVLVNDSAIADALAATPLAEELNAPILLTGKNKLNSTTKSEIERLGATNIYLIGGESVLSDDLSAEISGRTYRIAGSSRETTALAIAKKINELNPVKTIAVVNGNTGLADAVSIASVAAEKDMAIILSNPKSGVALSKEFIYSNGIEKSYVIGGDKAVPNYVMSSLPGAERVSGSNRNDTNAKVIEKFYPSNSLNNIYVAKNGSKNTGQLIDALAVGVLAAKNSSPVLIVSNSLSSSQRNVVGSKEIGIVTRVGGNGNESAFEEVKELQGIKPAELKLPSEMLCSWYFKYKQYNPDTGLTNPFYTYNESFKFTEDYYYISGYKLKYKVTKIDGNQFYVNIYNPEEWGGGISKDKYILDGNSLQYYYYDDYHGSYHQDATHCKGITLPNHLYKEFYRDDNPCMYIDGSDITIFGKSYKYETIVLHNSVYNEHIIRAVDNGKVIYFDIGQWGNKVAISYAYENKYNHLFPFKTNWKSIATFSSMPFSSEILGDIENLLPGMEV
ncbi:cell wall-binding repeat-containing protein [Peptacetobacter sp.]|uniref:cell wall-binding repeat-containing protein n=1 Tax=Peptacetobacter sp. TaxID=2991975 RepID=UPI002E790F0D|nr:cell wall-binding repeat-containing protein [Peptacetobacter sp.]MEE0452493.1 cell wall-binding repeat-containing protein [Peptacetobacter sp.]